MKESPRGSTLQNIPMNRRIAIGVGLVSVVGAGKIITDQLTNNDDSGDLKRVDGKFAVGQQVYPVGVFGLLSSAREDREWMRTVYYGDHIEIISGPYEVETFIPMYEVRINNQHLGFAFETSLSAYRV